MNWLIIWTPLIFVMTLLGWLACTYFWRYYTLFKHLVWGCLVLLVGFLSYDYGVDRGAWAVRDHSHVTQEAKADGLTQSDSTAAQEDAKIPFTYDTVAAGFLMYCIVMLLVGGQIANNSANKAALKTSEREHLFAVDRSTLSR